ncbi:MAG TPA: prolipoprotein diacylglyceryl transferase family protein [Gemmatimonadaceae bacterium]|nr:prolipoprotein diacylglyceryl transferase family protein [Gemmatimonadaceae bacterium]
MTLPHPIIHHPFAYNLGPLQITGFGIAILMCFVVAQVVAQRELVRRGHDPAPMADMVFAALIGGLLGAKLYYVVILGHWDAILDRGGFVYWGGFIGGALAVMGVVLHKRAGLARMADVSAPALAGAYAIGRTGCWAIGDDYGRPWNGFLAVAFPDGAPPSTAGIMARDFGITVPAGVAPATVLSVYPTQLAEVAMGLAIFGVLWRWRDHAHAEGWLFGVYCVLMGVERFLIEFLRAKDDRFVAGLTYAQVIALGFMVLGAVIMAWRWRVGEGKSGIYAVGA